jgi:hypothetical protein
VTFLISVIDTATNTGSGDEIADIDAFNDSLVAGGHWIFAGGLAAPDSAIRFDNRGGAGITIDGPLHDPHTNDDHEHVSGFWLIEATNETLARELAQRGSRACNRKVELRALLGG